MLVSPNPVSDIDESSTSDHADMSFDSANIVIGGDGGQWEGQSLELKTGDYVAEWSLTDQRKGTFKGCRIRTYRFVFTDDSHESVQGLVGEFTIHSRRSKGSISSKVDMLVDADSDGIFAKNEALLSSVVSGFKVNDEITDYASPGWHVSHSLRRLSKAGQLSFQIDNDALLARPFQFQQSGDGNEGSFEAFGASSNITELVPTGIVC